MGSPKSTVKLTIKRKRGTDDGDNEMAQGWWLMMIVDVWWCLLYLGIPDVLFISSNVHADSIIYPIIQKNYFRKSRSDQWSASA